MARTWPYSVCWIRVLLICKPRLSVYIVSWTRIFKVIMRMSHNHQSTRVVWIFHRVVSGLVLRTVGVMRRVHRAFEAFDDPDGTSLNLLSSGFSQVWSVLSAMVTWHRALAKCHWSCGTCPDYLSIRSREVLRFWMLIESCVPPNLLLTKCPG
jgi:hypothetical protein